MKVNTEEAALNFEAHLLELHDFICRVDAMLADVARYGTHLVMGREVCAKRARKLRKRGHSTVFVRRTKNGKALYRWMRRMPPWAMLAPSSARVNPVAEGNPVSEANEG